MRPVTSVEITKVVISTLHNWLGYCYPLPGRDSPQFKASVVAIHEDGLTIELGPTDHTAVHPDDAQPQRYRLHITTTKDEK